MGDLFKSLPSSITSLFEDDSISCVSTESLGSARSVDVFASLGTLANLEIDDDDVTQQQSNKQIKTSDSNAVSDTTRVLKFKQHPKRASKKSIIVSDFQRQVCLKVEILKVNEIDTIKQMFTAVVFVKSRWREPGLDRQDELPSNDSSASMTSFRTTQSAMLSKWWNPDIQIANLIQEVESDQWLELEKDDNGRAFIVQKMKIKGTFHENMELEQFPFDIQDLSFLITSTKPRAEVYLCENLEDLSRISTEDFYEVEWKLKNFVHVEDRVVDDECSQNNYEVSGLYFRCVVVRRSTFFITNCFMVMLIILTMAFTVFSVPVHQPVRIELTIIIILVTINFKFTASESVPHISYLTHLDRYVLGSLVFLAFLCGYHSVLCYLHFNKYTEHPEWLEEQDNYMLLIFLSIFVLLHFIFVIGVYITGRQRRTDIRNIELHYMDRLSASKQTRFESLEKSHKHSTQPHSAV